MTVTRLIDDTKILREFTNWLRNSDILSVTTRGVTTTTQTGTFTAASSVLINRTNVKNIRSIVVAAVTLAYGTDWEFDLNYNDAGTIKTNITFVAAKTGAYTITYDYGSTDKIYDDYPRDDIDMTSYPRMPVEITSTATQFGDLSGAITLNDLLISFYIFDVTKRAVRDYTKTLRTKVLENQRGFYNIRYLTPVGSSPIIPQPNRHDKVVLKTLECRAPLNEEVTS